jgi:plastocyanin
MGRGRLAGAIAGALMLVAACGGGADEGGEAEPAPASPASDEAGATSVDPGGTEAIEILGTEFRFDPSTVTIEAPGKSFLFRLVNNGSAPHALEIEGNGIEEKTETIGPGESSELTVDLVEGEYEMYCPVGDHRDQGMEGTLIVEGG